MVGTTRLADKASAWETRAIDERARRLLQEGRTAATEELGAGADDRDTLAVWGMTLVARANLRDEDRLPRLDCQSAIVPEADLSQARRAAAALDECGYNMAASSLRRALVETTVFLEGAGSSGAIAELRAYLSSVAQQDLGRVDLLARGYELLTSWLDAAKAPIADRAEALLLLAQARAPLRLDIISPLELALSLVSNETPAVLGMILCSLAHARDQRGRTDEARELRERAGTLVDDWAARDSIERALWAAKAARTLGTQAREQGELDVARHRYEQALRIVRKDSSTAAAVEQSLIHRMMAATYVGPGQDQTASRKHLEAAIALVDSRLGPQHNDVAYAHADLGIHLWDTNVFADAIPHLEQAVTIGSSNFGTGQWSPALHRCRAVLQDARTRLAEIEAGEAELLAGLERYTSDMDHPLPMLGISPDQQLHAACTALRARRNGEGLDRLMAVLEHGDKQQRAEARELAKLVLRRYGVSAEDVNTRRRSLMVYL